MIRPCLVSDMEAMCAVINEAAQAYRGVIPADCCKEPYMARRELQHEMDAGVMFWGYEEDGELIGVMGLQHIRDVALIRHAYVRMARQRHGVGSKLLGHLRALTSRPILIGTWSAATWAIRFYARHGFRMVSVEEKDRVLKTYWSIPDRQVETSVVLGNERWFDRQQQEERAVTA